MALEQTCFTENDPDFLTKIFAGLQHMEDTMLKFELVRVFMTERERGNFVLDKADFADVAGSYGEKIQRSIK